MAAKQRQAAVMELRGLGRSGIRVSTLGLGTVKFGRSEGLKYPTPFGLPNQAAINRLLDTASDLGINLLDTAPAYGNSETRLGAAIKGHRSKWVLTTKVGETFSEQQSVFDFSPESVCNSVMASLQRLQTDFLDVVLIHSDGNDIAILEQSGALDMLKSLKSRGIIRAIGISHKSIRGGLRALELECDVLMTTLNLNDTSQLPVISAAAEKGCGILVKKALESGHADLRGLRFAASQPGVSSVVVGTINPEHLAENAQAVIPTNDQ
jgi:aryl-alcohol dehydrogenase-like predicted oxidoreductase